MRQCRSCGANIQWAETASGKLTPVDAIPVEDGNIVLHVKSGNPLIQVARILTKDEIAQARSENARTGQTHRLFKSHFATCPNARQHRKS